MNFKVGQKVICIKKGKWQHESTGETHDYGPFYGEECVIHAVHGNKLSIKGYLIHPVHHVPRTMYSDRFRPLADDGIEEKLEEILKEVKEEQLTLVDHE